MGVPGVRACVCPFLFVRKLINAEINRTGKIKVVSLDEKDSQKTFLSSGSVVFI